MMRGLTTTAVFLAVLVAAPALLAGQAPQPDPFAPIRFLAGEWAGKSDGQPGAGTVKRSYEFVLSGRFLHERNVSTYPPQPANKAGEVHEHWSFFSYDRARKLLILRQFHQEGFVNQYALNAAESSAQKLVFDSEQLENVNSTWRARETYDIRSSNEFVETFELGAAGKPLEVYSRNHFKRATNRP
jgi:hypothetical protein